MQSTNNFLSLALDSRINADALRALKIINVDFVDLTSNDYLGFAVSEKLHSMVTQEIYRHMPANGSTGSRLLTGNSAYAENLEQSIASYHGHDAGLLFNSGYDANIGLFSSIAQRGDTLIADEFIHASIIDGIRLSNANRYTFKHNNLDSLREKLNNAKGNIYVATESVYSMDGDTPDISAMVNLCKEYNAGLIVDEAHAIGVFGKGIIDNLGLQNDLFARVITYGKAMGVHGAIVLGSNLLRDYLINFARSFIYTTAAPLYQLVAIKMAYKLLDDSLEEQASLRENIAFFNTTFNEQQLVTRSSSAIQSLKAGSNQNAKSLSQLLAGAGIDVRPILSPTVAAGTERLRVCLHSFNNPEQITLLAQTINRAVIS